MLRLLSAEGSGFDLTSFKAVVLDYNTLGGGEASVLAGESVFRESQMFCFAPLPSPQPLPNLPLQNRLNLSFSDEYRVVYIMGRQTNDERNS